MFYLAHRRKGFFIGYVDGDSPVMTLHEGTAEKGITSKKEMVCNSQAEAWSNLCQHVASYRSEGYRDQTVQTINNFIPPTAPYEGQFPEDLSGVLVSFSEIDDAQWLAGCTRLTDVHNALKQGLKAKGVRFAVSEEKIAIQLNSASFVVTRVSPQAWEAMPGRARDQFSDRKYIDSKTLMPSGAGQCWICTGDGLLDVYLRAFLGELKTSGALFTAFGEEWHFNPLKPFDPKSVFSSRWCSQYPDALTVLNKAGLAGGMKMTVAAATATSNLGFFL